MAIDVKNEKNFGLWGSILALVAAFMGAIPYIGVFGSTLSLIAFILVLLALKGIGNKVGDERPFKYYLYSVIVAIAGVVFAIVLILIGAITLPKGGMNEPYETFGIGMVLLGIILIIAVFILAVYFQKQAWEVMYEITGVEEFQKTAKWLWWGALTLIILIGSILLLIAAIYQIIAFSNMPEELEFRGTYKSPIY
ncbi:DUF996 domain-containing protein [Thermococcus sp. GR6]|uniref:DUF996 domain-containing protein n=1 Tax=Thermococcus sp. GR6 TaxID=1638256 RepID=UPI0014307141|nr:DUF996 domain-containing protein [Thermococcus sp. GR6]NJE42307.1 DUF996 domain-containing protein [Thermococcus sp. GR6]